MKIKSIILILLVTILVLTGCAQTDTIQPAAEGLPQTGSIEGPCVDNQEGVELLMNGDHGYCLLYPTGFDVARTGETGTTLFVDSLLNVEQPRADIRVEEAAGRTAEQAADEIQAGLEGFEIERSTRQVAGEDAVVLDNLPGQEINRQVILVHGERLYNLSFIPADKNLGERYEAMEAFYTAVIESLSFLPEG